MSLPPSVEAAALRFVGAPDVHFNDAHRVLVKVVTNIAGSDDPKFRRLNMNGKAFAPVVAAHGMELLLSVGFVLDASNHLTLPPSISLSPAFVDYVLNMEAKKVEVRKLEQEAWQRRQAAKESEKQKLREKIKLDRTEASQRPVVASRSTLVPFSGREAVGCSDIGIGKDSGRG